MKKPFLHCNVPLSEFLDNKESYFFLNEKLFSRQPGRVSPIGALSPILDVQSSAGAGGGLLPGQVGGPRQPHLTAKHSATAEDLGGN